MTAKTGVMHPARVHGVLLVAAALSLLQACTGSDRSSGRTFKYTRELHTVEVSYLNAPPNRVYDSVRVGVTIRSGQDLGTDSLLFELLPAENGWARAVDTILVRDSSGLYRSAIWICPTVPGQFVLSWQTIPFTGFTYYLAARYDSLGQLLSWDNAPIPGHPWSPLIVRDTMEVVFRFWPHVWYRRLHIVRRPDARREFYLITQSYQRGPGVSGRILRYSANLRLNPEYPLRTRRWREAGWVVDTVSVWVRDTLVAWMAWTYDEFLENWERNYSIFREWQHTDRPELYFKINDKLRMDRIWLTRPEGEYVAARMYADTSRPAFDSLKRQFIREPAGGP